MLKEQFEKNKIGWKKSFLEGFSQDENGAALPWMTYPAIEFLKNNLTKNHEVFEFGCGASTLFFAKRVKKVVGLETDERWLGIVEKKLGKEGQWTPQQVRGDKLEVRGDKLEVRGDKLEVRGDKIKELISSLSPRTCCGVHHKNVELYLMPDGLANNSYENFPKNSGKKFDFIIIDSLKRFECAKNAIEALKPDGRIILDDSERKNYQKIFDFFAEKNFTKQDFFGIAPGQLRVKNTTIFYR